MTLHTDDQRLSPRPRPEVIREFNDRGTLWLLEDPALLGDLLRILQPDLAGRFDFRRATRLNRSFVPADLQKQESDLLFRVPFVRGEGTGAAWVYVLLEHQSRPDREMPLRLLLYMSQLWDLQRREWQDRRTPVRSRRLLPVVPIVFYTGRKAWKTPLQLANMMDARAELQAFVPQWETLFLSLHGTPPETFTRVASGIGWALRVLQEEQTPLRDLERVLAEAMAGLEGLSKEQKAQWLRIAWYLLMASYHRRGRQEYTSLERLIFERARASKFRVREEVTVMGQTMAQYHQQLGQEVGRREGLRIALEAILTQRFGSLPDETAAALEAADQATLQGWITTAATADSLREVNIRPSDRTS